jgi:thioesterase domain-containing protein
MELISPGIPQHHLPFALEAFGDLDVSALQLSLDLIVDRHEALRTVFMADGGALYQVISGPRAVVRVVDAPSGPNLDLHAILREQVAAPFDLGRGPLVRLVAVRRAPGTHILVFVLHHIIADNLSLGLFAHEMAEVYGAISARSEPALTPLSWQYADFAIAEARWLASPTFRARLQRYADKLGPTMARLDLGSESMSAAGQPGANQLISIEPVVLDRIKQVAKRANVTLFTVLLAALETVLVPYADGPNFVIAIPVAGRGSDGADGVIGPFANIVGLKTNLRAGQTMAELLADVRSELLDTLDYENVPWDALVRAINPSRSADRAPLSQVVLSSIAVPAPFQQFGRLPCRPVWLPSPAPPSDLFVSASETPDGRLLLSFDSRSDRVSNATVSSLSRTLRTLFLEIARGDITTLEAYPRWRVGDADRPPQGGASADSASATNNLPRKSAETLKRRMDLEKLVAESWRNVLGAPPSHERENFFAAGGDSLLALRLMSAVADRLDRKLPAALLFQNPTVLGLAASLIESESNDELDLSVTKLANGLDGRVLFLSSGHPIVANLAAAMGQGPSVYKLDAYALQEQRLLGGHAMFESVEAVATEFRRRLKAIQPKGPYLLAGYCEGGMVAYEMAIQFQQQGEDVALLGQLDTPVRGFLESKPAFLGPIRHAKSRVLDFVARRFHPKTPEQNLHERIWATIWLAVRSYSPDRCFDGDVHQFRAAIPRSGMADVATGWDRRITGRVVIHDVPGRHLTFMEDPQTGQIVRAAVDTIMPPPVPKSARDPLSG